MRIKSLIVLGAAAAGYYAGSRAGRDRYEQINRVLGMASATTRAPVGEKTDALRNLALEWVRDSVDEKLHSFRGRTAKTDRAAD